MEQSETPQEPPPAPAPPPQAAAPPAPEPAPPPPKPELPNPRGALPIPDNFRLPFHGKMVTPTAVPSATERRYNLSLLQKRKRRRGYLIGLLVGQIFIIGMDVGGALILKFNPQIKLTAPVGVASIVFLGMAIGAAVMLLAIAILYAGLGLRALFGNRRVGLFSAVGGGIQRIVQTFFAVGLTMAVILGTAWFMIPGAEWKPTADFAKAEGRKLLDGTKHRVRSLFRPGAPPQ